MRCDISMLAVNSRRVIIDEQTCIIHDGLLLRGTALNKCVEATSKCRPSKFEMVSAALASHI